MKTGIVYMLSCIFLLFMVESRNYIDFQQNFGDSTPASSHLFKKHKTNQTALKHNQHQSQDSFSITVEDLDDDFQTSDAFALMLVVSGFSLKKLYHILYGKFKKFRIRSAGILSTRTKTFIRIRCIRI